MTKLIILGVVLQCAGCHDSGSANNCPTATPLACVGTSDCCPTSAPIQCGSSCFNTQPTAAECAGSAESVCLAASTCQSGDYCYEWICFGDPECMSTNPNGSNIGANDEGNDSSCQGLITFGEHNWGIPPAWQACVLVP